MKQNLRVSLGAVVLALTTLAAVIFALLNFDQRNRFEVVSDGVAWLETDQGIQARQIAPNSPATRAGIREALCARRQRGAATGSACHAARPQPPGLRG